MLHVTRQAMDVIRDLIAAADTPTRGGLHIRLPTVPRSDFDRLEGVDLEVVRAAPPSTLQLRAGQDCRLFLDLDAAQYVRDKVLHATHGTDGAMRFVLTRTMPTEAREVEVAEPVQES
ncbi:MAG: hypothetical protein GEV00_04530 [Actinophytocola sp.]|nr:hypothetical protein [Actinophytocola sp.]